MMAGDANHYEVLGLASDASADTVKARFRELARRYHPDVATVQDAEDRFRAVNAAYQVLGDPRRRAAYDAELQLAAARARRAAENRGRKGGHSTPHAGHRERGSPAPAQPTPSGRRRPSEAGRLVEQARTAHRLLQFRAAEQLCRQALQIDRRQAGAYEVLGDVHRSRGHQDEALAMYSFALQLDRGNQALQAKLDRLVGRPPRASARSEPRRSPTPAGRVELPSSTRMVVTGVGLALYVFSLCVAAMTPAPPAASILFLDWNPELLLGLASAGAVTGLLMAVNDIARPARAELALNGGRSGGAVLPLGFALLGFAIVWFYAAFALYVALAIRRDRVSKSIACAFAATFLTVALYALVRWDSAQYIVATGGNLVFVALVIGWATGDAVLRREQGAAGDDAA
ncbi:MAG TPA: DnaJ domain-containing protein [Chthonomonadales bacterium]|nr:DnaJ domain-containing protein [Chthonomonadales bacterium]